VRNARLWTSGAVRDGIDTLAIAGGRIVACGAARHLEPLAGPHTQVLDAAGATVTPGIVDAHVHLVDWARAIGEVALDGCATRADAIARVAAHAARDTGGAPIVGRGFDSNGWDEPPARDALDRVTGSRPALLHSHDYHSLWVNSAALAACGIGRDTPDPAGGRIVRDAAGEPTGLLLEHAVRPCAALLEAAAVDPAAAVARALPLLHARGVTGVHDFEGPLAMRVLRDACGGAAPRLRVLMHLAHARLDEAIALGLTSGIGDDAFRIGAIKLFADGTLGSRTAAMLAAYDGTQETGMDLIPPVELAAIVRRAVDAGLSVAIHAIGDRAVRSSLDAFEAAGPALARLAMPPRIEHAQLVDAADVPRFARLGVVASMQPSHATADAALAHRHWGGRAAASYPWRTLLDRGARLAFGSDAPVEPPDAPAGLAAAVTRVPPGAASAFTPEQRVTLDEALSAYTEGPARAAGTWPRTGALEPGAIADVVVWNEDLHALPPGRLAAAAPATVIVAGGVVHSASESPVTAGVPGGGR